MRNLKQIAHVAVLWKIKSINYVNESFSPRFFHSNALRMENFPLSHSTSWRWNKTKQKCKQKTTSKCWTIFTLWFTSLKVQREIWRCDLRGENVKAFYDSALRLLRIVKVSWEFLKNFAIVSSRSRVLSYEPLWIHSLYDNFVSISGISSISAKKQLTP